MRGKARWDKNIIKPVEEEDGCSYTTIYRGSEGCHKLDFDHALGMFYIVQAMAEVPLGLYLVWSGSKTPAATSLIIITLALMLAIFSVFVLAGFLNLISETG